MFKDHKRFCKIRLAPNCPPWPELQRHMWLSLRNRKTIRKLGTIRGMAAACRRTIFIPDDSLGSPAPKEWCLCTRQKSQVALFEEILTMSTAWTVKSILAQKFLLKPKTTEIYSSNKIRNAWNENFNIACIFLNFWGLFLLLFVLKTVEVS